MATLKVSELSVRDWVICNGFKATIAGYNAESGSIQVLTKQKNKMWFGLDDIEPIPITAEILEANGFAKAQRGGFYHYLRLDKNRTLYIHASTNGWRVEVTYDAAGILRTTHLMPDINSVHQLQHALRLAGVDKEINL